MGVLDDYENQLRFTSCKEGTIYRYIRVSRLFLEFSKGNLTREEVIRFINSMQGSSSTYRRWVVYALKGLFKAAKRDWVLDRREMPKLSKPNQPFLNLEQVESILDLAKDKPLHYALFRLMAALGCRREELVRMRDYDFDYAKSQILVRTAKEEDNYIRTLDAQTCEILKLYLKSQGSRTSNQVSLFLLPTGRPVSISYLASLFRTYATKLGLDKGTGWHSFRRGLVTWLYEGGMREKELQELMGWRSPEMPSRYIRLSSSEVDKKALGIHPFNVQKKKEEKDER